MATVTNVFRGVTGHVLNTRQVIVVVVVVVVRVVVTAGSLYWIHQPKGTGWCRAEGTDKAATIDRVDRAANSRI